MRHATLIECCTFISDGTHASPIRTETGVPVLSAQNVNNGILSYKTDRYTSDAEYQAFRKRLSIAIGDVLLTIVGSIGRSAIVRCACPLVFQRSVAVMRCDPEKLHGAYLYHVIQSDEFQRQLARATNQSSQAGVYLGKLGRLSIPLPSLREQRRIAAILDQADALRTKRRQALAKLDMFIQSAFDNLIACHSAVKHAQIEDVLESLIDYRGKSPAKTESGVPLVTARIVKGGELLAATEYIAEANYLEWMRRGVPKAGDVVFTTEAPLGEVAQLDDRKVALAQRLLVLRGKPAVLDNEFLMFVLRERSVRNQIEQRSTGSTVKGIRQREFRKVTIPLPPVESQRTFSKLLRSVKTRKDAQRKQMFLLDGLFQSLQHRAFRGEL